MPCVESAEGDISSSCDTEDEKLCVKKEYQQDATI